MSSLHCKEVFLVCIAASALGQVTKEQVDVFFPHIFNQSVSVYICICIEQRDVECQRWDFEKHSIFIFFFRWKQEWVVGRLDKSW